MANLIKLNLHECVDIQKQKTAALEARIEELELQVTDLTCPKHPKYVGIDLIRAIKCNTCLKIYADRTSRKHVCGRGGYKKHSSENCIGCERRWRSAGILIGSKKSNTKLLRS